MEREERELIFEELRQKKERRVMREGSTELLTVALSYPVLPASEDFSAFYREVAERLLHFAEERLYRDRLALYEGLSERERRFAFPCYRFSAELTPAMGDGEVVRVEGVVTLREAGRMVWEKRLLQVWQIGEGEALLVLPERRKRKKR